MKRVPILILFSMLAFPLAGCPNATSPSAAASAPGYVNSTDQQIGQSLAALRASVNQATLDYPKLSQAQQQAEKATLNAFVTAVNLADSTYLAFHNGTATLQQAQDQLAKASAAQTAFVEVAK